MPFSPALQWLGLAVETTPGTIVAPTVYIPMDSPQWTPNQAMLKDMGLRGSMVDIYNLVQGMRYDDFSFGGAVFEDSFPNLIRAVLGSPDTLTGSSAPYSHKIGLLNNANGGQAPTYTLSYFDGDECPQLAGALCDNIAFKFTPNGMLEYTTKFVTNDAVAAGTIPTEVLETNLPMPAWDVVAQIGGVGVTRITDGELDLKRNAGPIWGTTGTQNPYRLWQGPLSCDGKLTLVYEAGQADLNEYLANTQPSLDLVFTNPAAATHSVEAHLSKVAWETGKITTGKEYLETELTFVGIPNATDAVAGGVAPVVFTIKNAQSTTY